MQVQLTISDDIAKQAKKHGLFDQKVIENLLLEELIKNKTAIGIQKWREIELELADTWKNFPNAEKLIDDLRR